MSELPASLRGNPRLSRWLTFRPEGIVEARSGKVELGQGVLTALLQIVADELDVAPGRVRMMRASSAESPNEGVTSGSLSIQDSGAALRHVCAEARALFVAAAAARLGVDGVTLQVRDGDIVSADGRRTSYWALAGEGLLERDATAGVVPKRAEDRFLVGRSMPRLDLPDKVFGRARYVHDMDLPGMLHGRVLRPPSVDARLVSLDETRARELEGVFRVLRDGSLLGVLAKREDVALRALERLRAGAQWEERDTLPDAARLESWIRAQPVETTVIAESGALPSRPVRTHRERFTRPFTAHASLGPSCAVAEWKEDVLHVWTHAQGVFNLRADLALVFSMPAEKVVVEHREGAGCYGHNGADDVALDAALLARAAAGRPVKVVWSREDELAWAPFGPAMLVEIEADLDAEGEVVAWRSDVWSNGHGVRPGRGKRPVLLAGSHLAALFERPLAVNAPLSTGGGSERNAVPPYGFAALRVRNHRLLAMPVRASALRSLGAYANVFAIESVVDRIARDKGEDPVAWRLRHLGDERARAVVQAAVCLAGPPGAGRREGTGRGFGYARYKDRGAYCAVVAEIEAEREIRVRRLAIAIDVGLAVNPDGVANQVEGGAIQATSWALRETVRFDARRVTSGSWESYPILRFSEVPRVEVEVLQQRDAPSVGAGEAAMGPVVAAIGNAIFDALGVRVRDLPFTAERIAVLA